MCRTGGRRCPSSRPSSRGGTRGRQRPAAGQPGDTAPPSDSSTPPPRPSGFNYAAPTATVGGQYENAHIHGGITFTPAGIVITGPVTGTPSAQPTARQAAAAEAAATRAMQTARNALRAASQAARAAPGDTSGPNIAGDGDRIAVQAAHIHISGRGNGPASRTPQNAQSSKGTPPHPKETP